MSCRPPVLVLRVLCGNLRTISRRLDAPSLEFCIVYTYCIRRIRRAGRPCPARDIVPSLILHRVSPGEPWTKVAVYARVYTEVICPLGSPYRITRCRTCTHTARAHPC